MTPEEQKADIERRQAIASNLEYLKETAGWTYIKEWLDQSQETYDKALKSKEFVDDHNGYLNARALFAANQNLLDFIEGAIFDGTAASRELSELDRPPGEFDLSQLG